VTDDDMSMIASEGIARAGARRDTRLCFHGVDQALPTLAQPLPPELLAGGARINLTLRRVT